MSKAESEFVLMCAVDYAINRHTYAASMMVGIIKRQWVDLSQETKRYITQMVNKNYNECDNSWHELLKL